MAFKVADRVLETSTSTGTGTINLAGATSGYQSFIAGVGSGNSTYYCIYDPTAYIWEVGSGTVTSGSPNTLSRTTIFASSNSGSAITLLGNSVNVFCTLPAEATPTTSTITNTEYTATSGQTVFSATYTPGLINVYRNGVRLGSSDYTATNGTSVTLATGAFVGDLVSIEAFSSVALSSLSNPPQIGNLVPNTGAFTTLSEQFGPSSSNTDVSNIALALSMIG